MDASAGRGPEPSDSTGVPWRGRTLPDPGFAGDLGTADPLLVAALQEYDRAAPAAQGTAGPGAAYDVDRHVRAHEGVLAALAPARLLVPVVAVLGEAEEGAHGLAAEKSADMALVTLAAPDGSPAVPAFTALDRLTAWRTDARPVAADARRVALSAVDDGATRLVLDPAGPVPYVVTRPALWALAQGRPWLAPEHDPEVLAALAAALTEVREVRSSAVGPQPPCGLRLVLALEPGLDAATVDAVVTDVAGRLGRHTVLAERVEGLALSLAPAAAPWAEGLTPLAGQVP